LAVRGNRILTTDYYDDAVYSCDKEGTDWYPMLYGFYGPMDLCFDKQGNLFVAEWDGGNVARVRAGKASIARIATGMETANCLEVDGRNEIFVTDYTGRTIWKLFK
jgi:sugar lactone lactonase YvrE